MKKLLLYIALVLFSYQIKAQSSNISGRIFTEKDEIIDYATIFLLSKDSVLVDGVLTDRNGAYCLDVFQGEYILQIRALGYLDILRTINIPKDGIKQDFHMTPINTALNEVVIIAKKPLIRREADRIIFDANNVAAGSNDALDILKNVPGVMVSNDGIKILGQQGVKVLINDRDTKMSGNDLFALLKSYQAEQIDKIEVISTPPSNFEAEGSAGILNIKLKKMKADYMGTTLNYAYSYDKYHVNEANANFIYNKNKIGASLNIGGVSGKTQYKEKNQEEHETYNRRNSSKAINKTNAYNFRGNIEYQINNNIQVGTLATYNKNKNNINLSGESGFYSKDNFTLDSLLLSTSPNETKTNNYRGNIYSDIKIDTLGKKIHFDMDYIYSKYSSEKLFASKSYDSELHYIGGDYNFNNDNDRKVNAFISSVDFILPFSKYTLNFGAKISFAETKNKIYYYNQPSLEDQNNDFSFKENIYALYVDFNKKLSKKLTFKSGLRLEHTYTKGIDKGIAADNSQQNRDNYTRLFPTLYLGYKPNQDHQFNFSFSSRISRPSFRNINPFVLYTNKYSTVSGKPDLKSSYTYRLNLGYTLKGNFNVDAFYSYKSDGFTQVQKFNNETLIMNTFWDNVLDIHSVGINNSYFFNKVNWLQIYFIHGINYEKSYSNSIYTISQRNTLLYIAMINTSFFFNKKKTFTGWLNTSYTSPEKLATSDLRNTYNINVGSQYSLLDNKLKISLSLNNIISSHVKGEVNSNNFKMYFDNKYNYPTLKLAIIYILGAKLTGKRYNNTEIQNRL